MSPRRLREKSLRRGRKALPEEERKDKLIQTYQHIGFFIPFN